MRLSISARIFLGFLVVLAAFGAVMGFTFYRMHRLRQDLQLINKSYLDLTLTLAELRTIQRNLINNVAERGMGSKISKLRWTQVRSGSRVILLRRALDIVRHSRDLSSDPRHLSFMADAERRLASVQREFRRNEPLLEQLFPPGQRPVDPQTARRVSDELVRVEEQMYARIKQVSDAVRGQVRDAAVQIEVDENNAVWAILITMVIAVLVSLVVTFGSQLTLRPLKQLVAGTKRIGTGDYSHRVEIRSRDELGVLSREFNSMAAAIEEREQRLIRSERMAAAGQIASHITHEIRNPLSSISLNTELLEEELVDGGDGDDPQSVEGRRLCHAIRREVDRLTDITEEYLRFARLPSPRLGTEDVNEILIDLLSFVSGELASKGIELGQELAPDLPSVEADENQLRQAFLNLLRNAGEAMAREGGALTVATRADRASDEVEVTIRDTGVGICEEHLSKLFEPFFSTKETGTGLGLALTQQIIQEHGGSITVSSAPGRGTTFTVRLPTARHRDAAKSLEHPSGAE